MGYKMGILDFFKSRNFDEGLKEFYATPSAVLLDVRTREEYLEGHVEKSVNIPLDELGRVTEEIECTQTPVFVYCYSGARSAQAAAVLRRLGYVNVKKIGGIASYSGKAVCR